MTVAISTVVDGLDPGNIRFVDVDGVRTRYYEAGQGEPLVLVHGGDLGSLYSLDCWSLNLPELARHFHVYALDKLGNGHTENPTSPADYTAEAVFRHTYRFLATLGLGGVHLVGHSRGGLLVSWLALEHQELVKSVVIVDSGSTADDDKTDAADDFYNRLGHRERLLEGSPTEELVRVEPEAQAYRKEQVTEDFIARMLEIARLPKTIDAQRYIRSIRLTSWLTSVFAKRNEVQKAIDEQGLPVPTLVIWGVNDRSAPFHLGVKLFQRIAATTFPAELHAINGAGHYVFRDQPEAFHRALRSFCLR